MKEAKLKAIEALKDDFSKENSKRYKKEKPKKEDPKEEKSKEATPMLMIRIQKLRGK